ncbi:hypothetical protein Tco_0572409, partial [Tanacetum coccineum]
MWESQIGYDALNCKWKSRLCLKVGEFCAVHDSVKQRSRSGANDQE